MYRVSQEERTKLWERVPYVKLYRYNPKHLCPKLNGFRDNGKWSLKLWQLLHTYWLPNSYGNWQEYVVSVMVISVLNIKVTCEWHKAIKLNYKNSRIHVFALLRLRSTVRRPQLTLILWRQSYRDINLSSRSLHEDIALPGVRSGWILRHGRHTVRGHHRSTHFSIAINSVNVQLWI